MPVLGTVLEILKNPSKWKQLVREYADEPYAAIDLFTWSHFFPKDQVPPLKLLPLLLKLADQQDASPEEAHITYHLISDRYFQEMFASSELDLGHLFALIDLSLEATRYRLGGIGHFMAYEMRCVVKKVLTVDLKGGSSAERHRKVIERDSRPCTRWELFFSREIPATTESSW